MRRPTLRRFCNRAALAIATALAASTAWAYTAPYSTPQGITLVDVSKLMTLEAAPIVDGIPQFLWWRLGDADGNPLYTYDADQNGRSSCYDACAKEFPPFVADAHARASGDFSIIRRDDHVPQWVYQGKPLYRYSGSDPVGEPVADRFHDENPAWADPSSSTYSPRHGWRRAAYVPAKSTLMPPTVELDALAVANGFGLVDAATHLTIYAVPVSHRLSSDWRPVRASALALPVGDFSIITRKDDGTRQWSYRREALYTYAGDYTPGEVTGIFTGDSRIQAALVYRNFMPAGITIGQYVGRGPLMTTAKGLSLYTEAPYYTQYGGRETRTGYAVSYNQAKALGAEGCLGDCTKTWKPLLAPANAQAWGFWEVIARPDGGKQWVLKGSPVYTYVGDKKPGDLQSNNRHVIVFGGPQGDIVYRSIGRDPKDPNPSLGRIDVGAAEGQLGPVYHHAEHNGEASGLSGDAGTGAGARPALVRGAGRARAIASRAALLGGGAGFYWHVVGIFY
jgi:predicted lipoprotein with Yx(FWY)xxD motif